MQKAEKNDSIEKVGRVFGAYMESSPYMELLWSEKLGYVLMSIRAETSEIMESRVITDAESLCRLLIGEIVQNVLNLTGKGHDTYEADAQEHTEIKERLKPYMDQLPEYHYLCEELCL